MTRLMFVSLMLLFTANGFAAVEENDSTYKQQISFNKKKEIFKNRREKRRIGIHLLGLGPTEIIGLSLDGFITPKIGIELGTGLNPLRYPEQVGDLGYFIGGRYHFFGKIRTGLTPYAGLYTVFHHNGKTVRNHSLYIPVGFHKIKRNGFSWSAEIAYQRNIFTARWFTGSFKIGYQF